MRVLLSVLLLLVLGTALGSYLLLHSPDRLLRTVEWLVDDFTLLHLDLREPVLDIQQGRITAKQIHLYQDGSKGAPLLSILDFNARINLWQMLWQRLQGSALQAGSVIIYIAQQDETEDPSPSNWLRHLKWLPAKLQVGSLHLITHGADTRIFPLKNIDGERIASDKYRLTAAADYEGEPLDLRLYLYAMRSEEGFQGIELRGEFHATESSRLAILEGELKGGIETFSYDFSLSAAIPDIEKLLAGIEDAPAVQGSLQLQGRLQGDSQGYELSDAQFMLYNPPAYSLTATGDFSYQSPEHTMLNLEAEGHLAELGYIVNWIDLDLSSLGTANARLSVSGPLDNIAVSQFELTTLHEAGLELSVSGSLAPGALSGKSNTGGNQVQIKLHGPKLGVLSQWLGELPFEPGPWQLEGLLSGNADALQLEAVQGRLGDPAQSHLTVSGGIELIDLRPPISLASISGLKSQWQVEAPSLDQINQWLKLSLPPEHQLHGQASINGSGDSLQISDADIEIQGSDLQLNLAQLKATVNHREQWLIEGLQAKLNGSMSDSSALSQYLELAVPVMGQVRASANIRQNKQRYSLQDIALSINSQQLQLQASGKINDLLAFSGTSLALQFSHVDTATLVHTYIDNFPYQGPLGSLSGSGQLIQDGKRWNLHDIMLDSHDNDSFMMHAKGHLDDLGGIPNGNVELSAYSEDQQFIKNISGRAIPSFSARLQSKAGTENIVTEVSAVTGGTQWQLHNEIKHKNKAITGLSLALSSPLLWLTDLGIQAADPNKVKEQVPASEKRNPLEALIERLPSYPIDLSLDLGGIRGEQSQIQGLELEIIGSNGQYLLRELNVNYEHALAEFRGIIDLQAQPAAISIGGQALAIDMVRLIRDFDIDSDVEGVLNIRGGLTSRGITGQQWIESLDGSLALALEDAVIEGAAYDVLATDLLAWMFSGAALERSTYVDCTMAQFAVKSGVAKTDNLYVESPRMIAKGEGELDLVRQRLDITLTPRSKNRLVQIPSSVSLRGPMKSPKTSVSPIMTTANASAEALMLIPELALKLFGIKADKQKGKRPCQASLGN
ncbi:AsmA family protein [Parahaliea sp. F7430]|uniref:AsmA family protein n=1 Tax=Sediminihaliea albiluteola TaxID=2758564 RepID=A0A7W2TUD4_9GAMM|nr:AsmA-like C-terminal region-containing protein [Sediminihaliea albiluteola]MBA6412152.1 AsmA family protein [Sediminihaliea albiluteola]